MLDNEGASEEETGGKVLVWDSVPDADEDAGASVFIGASDPGSDDDTCGNAFVSASDPDADDETCGGKVLVWDSVPDADEDAGASVFVGASDPGSDDDTCGNALDWVSVAVADVVGGVIVSVWCNKLGLNAVVDEGVCNSSDERKDKLQLVKSFEKFGDSVVTRTNSE